MIMNNFKKAKGFVYRNARPLDLARFRFHFENGSADEVLYALSFYQNDDGGFAYAIEPDNWNESSTPIGTWAATMILREIGFSNTSHSIISGILKYLDSGKDFADGKWFNTVPGNNDYPHAVWWKCEEAGLPADNPTVSLAGFALRFADKASALYRKACEIATKSVAEFMKNPTDECHTVRCFADLLGYCEQIEKFNLFDINAFRNAIIKKVNETICKDTSKWAKEYVCTPSFFNFKKNNVIKCIDLKLCEYEAEIIRNAQLPDGSYPVTWQWYTDYKEFEIASNWWKSDIIIGNMLYLRELGKI